MTMTTNTDPVLAQPTCELINSVAFAISGSIPSTPKARETAKLVIEIVRAALASVPPSAPVGPYTYASTQATTCAGCGEHKHTPLRIDAMGGYVCLTCIDQKLGGLLGEFGYPPSAPVGVEWNDEAAWSLAARAEAAGAERDSDDNGTWWTLRIDHFNALAQQPAAPYLRAGDWPKGHPQSVEAAKAYIRDWCPDHVKDYIDSLAQQPAAPSGEAVAAVPVHYAENILASACLLEQRGDLDDAREAKVLRKVAGMMRTAPQRPAGVGRVCEWSQEDLGSDFVSTWCGHEFILNDASQHNDGASVFPFCCYCAKPMVLRHWRDEHSEEALAAQQQRGRADG